MMSEHNAPVGGSAHTQQALLRVLQATMTLPAQMTFYAAALGAIALAAGVGLPPVLATIAGGVGVNALSSTLERIARNEDVSDDEIRRQVLSAIDESQIAHRLVAGEIQSMIARLFRQNDVLRATVLGSEYNILERLMELAPQYEILFAELRSDVLLNYAEVQKSQEQNTEMIALLHRIIDQLAPAQPILKPGSAPPLPSLIVGREDDLHHLKARLRVTSSDQTPSSIQILTAIKGWPGVGKTTIAAMLAYDRDIITTFPDGILWTSLGTNPNLFTELAAWGRALGSDELLRAKTIEEASAQLAAMLRDKRILLIIDDVWEPEHAIPFKVGGHGCATLITTRLNVVAQALAPTANDIYRLPVLAEDKALDLLQALAPTVVVQYPAESRNLIHELEGLPLALQVAGHMLNVEASYGFGVKDLIAELREGARLLEAKAPADRTDLVKETTPTVAALLQRSTDHLDDLTRDCYAYLGVFAPKPATFDLAAMKAVWQVEQPEPVVRTLVDRGLLEFVPSLGRYQMHALLVVHAKSLLTEG